MKKTIVLLLILLALFLSGCAKEDATAQQLASLDSYISSVEDASNEIKAYLEHDAMTQTDMNMKSKELYDVWDDALNYLWSELKAVLPKEQFEQLQNEQITWITEKETAMKEAGELYEGGSMYALIINSEGATIMEERVYELYTLLKAQY